MGGLFLYFSSFAQALNGTYTLNATLPASGTNFQTFAAFTTSLSTNGVSGPVVLNVAEGVYNESVTFGTYTGTSATNNITVQADPANTNDAELTYANASSTDAAIIFDGASYITIDGLKITSTGTTYTRNVYFTNNHTSIKLTNNQFISPAQTTVSVNDSHLYGTTEGFTGAGITLTGNEFIDGSHIMYLTGTTTVPSTKFVFSDNVMTGNIGYMIYSDYVDTLIVENNLMQNGATTSAQYGIYLTNSTTVPAHYVRIRKNDLQLNSSGTMYGIYVSYILSSPTMRSEISNNMLSNAGTGGTSLRYAMYINGADNLDVVHNSISFLDGSSSTGRALFMTGSTTFGVTNTQVRNNIFANYGGGYAAYILANAISTTNNIDYNIYYGNGSTPFYYNGTGYSAFSDWQLNSTGDANSYFADPLFIGPNDLHVIGTVANDLGVTIPTVTDDIDGDTRPLAPSTNVDIGADEYTPSSCQPVTDIILTGITDNSVDVSWTSGGSETEWLVEIVPSGTTPTMTGTTVTDTFTTIGSLSGNTTYDVYIYADCSGTYSLALGGNTFTTLCGALMAPYLETFTVTSDPACWSQSATQGGPWQYTGNPGYTVAGTLDHTNGSSNNYAWLDFSTPVDMDVVLESPLIDVSALTAPELSFWEVSHYDGTALPDYNKIYVEAYNGTNWDIIDSVQGEFGPDWKQFTYMLTPYVFNTNLVKIRLRAMSMSGSSSYYNDLLIDDFEIREGPTCPYPASVNLVTAGTTDATVEWVSSGSETEWVVEYGPYGFTPGTGMGTQLSVTSNPFTISGLDTNAFYEVYVSAYCNVNDTSSAVGPVSFNTYNQAEFMEWDSECPTAGFNDISSFGTAANTTDDTELGVSLPFPILFQGVVYEELTIGNNGGVILGSQTANVGTTTGTSVGLYPYIQDLGTPYDNVYYTTVGSAPNRQFIVMWSDVPHYGTTATDGATFELIIDEGTQEVYFVYDDVMMDNASWDYGQDAEIGVIGVNQTLEVSVNSNQYLQENSCAHFYYTDCPRPSNFVINQLFPDEVTFSWTPGLSNETNWLVEYGEQGFTPGSGTIVSTTNPTASLIGLTQNTYYDVYVYAFCANGDQSAYLVGSFLTPPFCSNPLGTTVATAEDSILTNWNFIPFSPSYSATGFNIQYGPEGFNLYDGTVVNADANTSDTTFDMSLLSGGVYELYIQSVCGSDTSLYQGPIAFTMPLTNDTVCAAETLPVDGTTYVFNNTGSTASGSEAAIAPPATGAQTTDGWINSNLDHTTWFKFTAPASGNMRISGLFKGYDGQAAVYSVSDCQVLDMNSFTLEGANDNDLGGVNNAPNFTVCGLTPGMEYYLLHDSYGTSTGIYSLQLSEIDLNAGTSTGLLQVCQGDTVDLYTTITGNDAGGMFNDLQNTMQLTNSMFATSVLTPMVYDFQYKLVDGCAADSTMTQVEITGASNAGEDGTITTCLNQPVDLLSGLGGTVDHGGTWYDNSSNTVNSQINTGSNNGTFTYTYITSNGICAADTSEVTLTVDANCDYLSIEEIAAENMQVYPNPASDLIYVEATGLEGNYDVRLTDMNGRQVIQLQEMTAGEKVSLDVRGLEPGVYFVTVSNDQHAKVFKVVVE